MTAVVWPEVDGVGLLQQALIGSAWRQAGAKVVDRPDWFQVTTPLAKEHRKNLVYRAVLAEDEADARVAEVVEAHRERGAKLRWVVGPASRPLDLGERLVAHGMRRDADSVGFWCPTGLHVPAPDDVAIETMTWMNTESLVRAFAAGWERDRRVHAQIREDMKLALAGGAGDLCGFVAHVDDRLAGAAMLLGVPGSGLLLGAAVVPEYRGRGVYRALIRRRLEVLREAGVRLATIMAHPETSAPICERLGMREVVRFGYYLLD